LTNWSNTEAKPANGYSRQDLDALNNWWNEFQAKAVSVPVKGKQHDAAVFHQDP